MTVLTPARAYAAGTSGERNGRPTRTLNPYQRGTVLAYVRKGETLTKLAPGSHVDIASDRIVGQLVR